MAVLLDEARDCDIEIVDGVALIYRQRPWWPWTARGLLGAERLARVVGGTIRMRSRLYRDERGGRGEEPRAPAPVEVRETGRRVRVRSSFGLVLSLLTALVLGVGGIVSLVLRLV